MATEGLISSAHTVIAEYIRVSIIKTSVLIDAWSYLNDIENKTESENKLYDKIVIAINEKPIYPK